MRLARRSVWAVTDRPPAPSFDATLARMYRRRGVDTLPAHLEEVLGIAVAKVRQLDVGVCRVDRRPGAPVLARLFAARRRTRRRSGTWRCLSSWGRLSSR